MRDELGPDAIVLRRREGLAGGVGRLLPALLRRGRGARLAARRAARSRSRNDRATAEGLATPGRAGARRSRPSPFADALCSGAPTRVLSEAAARAADRSRAGRPPASTAPSPSYAARCRCLPPRRAAARRTRPPRPCRARRARPRAASRPPRPPGSRPSSSPPASAPPWPPTSSARPSPTACRSPRRARSRSSCARTLARRTARPGRRRPGRRAGSPSSAPAAPARAPRSPRSPARTPQADPRSSSSRCARPTAAATWPPSSSRTASP